MSVAGAESLDVARNNLIEQAQFFRFLPVPRLTRRRAWQAMDVFEEIYFSR